ncbi:hypothetical protein MnTg03_00614 [bacterium MnTg03]|nr:hypothetical protein MnTg03_00614 [bacterium MnTg03]
MIKLNISGGHQAGAFLANRQGCFVTLMHGDADTFQVQHDIDHVFLNTIDSSVFVQYAIDTEIDNCTSGNRGQQDSSQGITERIAKTSLQWFDGNLRMIGLLLFNLNLFRLQQIRKHFR